MEVLIVILVQVFQTIGTKIAVSLDHRITDKGGKKRRGKAVAQKIETEKRVPPGFL